MEASTYFKIALIKPPTVWEIVQKGLAISDCKEYEILNIIQTAFGSSDKLADQACHIKDIIEEKFAGIWFVMIIPSQQDMGIAITMHDRKHLFIRNNQLKLSVIIGNISQKSRGLNVK